MPVKSPLKDVLVAELREFSEKGRATILDRRFTADNIIALQKFLVRLTLRSEVGATILQYKNGKPMFVVGDKVVFFSIGEKLRGTFLVNCETNATKIPVGVPFMVWNPQEGLKPLILHIFIEGAERLVTQPSTPLVARAVEELGMEKALNVALLDAMYADYTYASLMARETRINDQEIRDVIIFITSQEPLLHLLDWLAKIPLEHKVKILRNYFQVGHEEELFSLDRSELKMNIAILGNDICNSYLEYNGYGDLSELINASVLMDIGRAVFGPDYSASRVVLVPEQ